MDDWLPIETAPDTEPVRVLLPNGCPRIGAKLYGSWSGAWDQRRLNGIGGWLAFNEGNQPVGWKPLAKPLPGFDPAKWGKK